MLKTKMQPNPLIAGALGEADAWDEPRWADHETHSSDYERAVASLHEPEVDLPAERNGRTVRPSLEQSAATYRARQGERRTHPEAAPDSAGRHGSNHRSAANPNGVSHTAGSKMQLPKGHRKPFPDLQSVPDTRASYPSGRGGHEADHHSPSPHAETTLADFRTLARTIEQMRGGRGAAPAHGAPAHGASGHGAPGQGAPARTDDRSPVTAPARATWLDDVRAHTHHAGTIVTPHTASAPVASTPNGIPAHLAPRGGAPSPSLSPVDTVADESLARSLSSLATEVASLANKADVARLEQALLEVVRRVSTLETRFHTPPADAAPRYGMIEEALAAPLAPVRSAGGQQPPRDGRPSRPRRPVSERRPVEPPRRLTVEMIEARIAERREAAERATRAMAGAARSAGAEPAYAAPRQIFGAAPNGYTGQTAYVSSQRTYQSAPPAYAAQTVYAPQPVPAKNPLSEPRRTLETVSAYEPRSRCGPRRLFS